MIGDEKGDFNLISIVLHTHTNMHTTSFQNGGEKVLIVFFSALKKTKNKKTSQNEN